MVIRYTKKRTSRDMCCAHAVEVLMRMRHALTKMTKMRFRVVEQGLVMETGPIAIAPSFSLTLNGAHMYMCCMFS